MLCLYLRAGVERLAVPATSVIEVAPAVPLHRPTDTPHVIAGVFRFRGAVTPVLDLHQLVSGEPCPVKLNSRIVVISHTQDGKTRMLGLLTEQVIDLKPLTVIGPRYTATTHSPLTVDLGPMVTDSEGMLRLPNVAELVPLAYPSDGR